MENLESYEFESPLNRCERLFGRPEDRVEDDRIEGPIDGPGAGIPKEEYNQWLDSEEKRLEALEQDSDDDPGPFYGEYEDFDITDENGKRLD